MSLVAWLCIVDCGSMSLDKASRLLGQYSRSSTKDGKDPMGLAHPIDTVLISATVVVMLQ